MCLGSTAFSARVNNPDLIQSYNGSLYSPSQPKQSIYKMIRDGTQGTQYGDGLVEDLNKNGKVYNAARDIILAQLHPPET